MHRARLADCLGAASHPIDESCLHREKRAKAFRRSFYTRIHSYGERCGYIAFENDTFSASACRGDLRARDGETNGISARECPRTEGMSWRIVWNSGYGVFVTQRYWCGIVQIPDPSMHSRIGGKNFLRPSPVERNQLLRDFFLGLVRLVRARKFAN